MTTQEKVDLLRKDFLRREGRNYTSASREGRLGWEKGLSGGDAYSSMMVAPKDDADLHRIAYNHARGGIYWRILQGCSAPFPTGS